MHATNPNSLLTLEQCDEALPACSQCLNTKRECPGYIPRFDLVLRDQTKAVRRKAQRKKQQQDEAKPPSPLQSASSEEPTSTTWATVNPGLDPSRVVARRYSSNDPIPRMFNDFPEQQAICAFFLDFVLLPRHPDSAQGHLEHLLPLYANTAAESPLSLATSSVALMISGNSPIRRNDQQLGRTIFGKALQKTSAAIRNPAESRKDETLMAVLLLGLFEVRCSIVLALVRKLVSSLSSRAPATQPTFLWAISKRTSLWKKHLKIGRQVIGRMLVEGRTLVGINVINTGLVWPLPPVQTRGSSHHKQADLPLDFDRLLVITRLATL